MAVAVLTEKFPSKPSELSEVEGKIRDAVAENKAQVTLNAKAKEAADRIKAGEDMKAVAKSMKLEVTEPAEFTRNDSVEGLGHSGLIPDAFLKPVGTVIGPIPVSNRTVVYKILARQDADLAAHAAERAAIITDLKRRRGAQDFALFQDAVVNKLVAEKKMKINRDAIKRLIASFHQ